MKDFLCPQCGAALKFTNRFSVSTVCEFCNSLVIRHDMNLQLRGKEGVLQDDLNPLQVGTRGVFQKTGFSIVGGVRLNHHEGFWQEWFLQLDQSIQNSQYAWLAQAQGEYQFLLEPIALDYMSHEQVTIGQAMRIGDDVKDRLAQWSSLLKGYPDAYNIVDLRTADMTHFTGQLPWVPDKNRKRTIAELSSMDDIKLAVEFGENATSLYYGKVMLFEDFKFQNLKEVKGW